MFSSASNMRRKENQCEIAASSGTGFNSGAPLSAIRDQRVDGERAGAHESESEARPQKQKLELVTHESFLELDQQDGAKHVAHEAERDQASQQTDDECNSTEELEQRDKRSH